MSGKDLLKLLLIGVLGYGLYKLGERNGARKGGQRDFPRNNRNQRQLHRPNRNQRQLQRPNRGKNKVVQVQDEVNEVDYIKNTIQSIRKKPNKTRKDRDIIELLEIKLKQLLNQ